MAQESFVSFIISTKISLLLAYIISFPQLTCIIPLEIQIKFLILKHNFFKTSFFPSVLIEWNKLDATLRRYDTCNAFKSNILKFIQPSSNSLFDCHNPIGIKYITRIRLELTHLREHRFKHSFQDTLNPICNYGIESAIHFSSTVPYIVKNVTHSSAI